MSSSFPGAMCDDVNLTSAGFNKFKKKLQDQPSRGLAEMSNYISINTMLKLGRVDFAYCLTLKNLLFFRSLFVLSSRLLNVE